MKHLLPIAALIAGTVLAPQLAQAADDKMMAAPPAMMICRAAKSGEMSNASMSSDKMVCKNLDMKALMASPAMKNAKTHDEMVKALQDFLTNGLSGGAGGAG